MTEQSLPPIERRCDTCDFLDMSILDEGPVLECHRFPPISSPDVPDVLPSFDDDVTTALEINLLHRFPVVQSDDWCGEYRMGQP